MKLGINIISSVLNSLTVTKSILNKITFYWNKLLLWIGMY